jgi:hypothetical protein
VSLSLCISFFLFLRVYYWGLLLFKKSKVRTTWVRFSELVIFFPCRSSTRICTTAPEEGRAAAAVTREKCTSWTSREEERAVSREREERERERERASRRRRRKNLPFWFKFEKAIFWRKLAT